MGARHSQRRSQEFPRLAKAARRGAPQHHVGPGLGPGQADQKLGDPYQRPRQ